MLAGKVPMFLYPFAINSVNYVSTILPCEALDMKSSPHKELFGDIPDISWLRAYGCDAYIHLPESQRSSFGVRAVRGILVGYDRFEETSSLA